MLANDGDPDGDRLCVASYTQPWLGVAPLNADCTITYTPNARYAGIDTFTYTITDGKEAFATARVSITVNGPPQAVDDRDVTNGNSLVVMTVLANDSDMKGDRLSVASFRQPSSDMASLKAYDCTPSQTATAGQPRPPSP